MNIRPLLYVLAAIFLGFFVPYAIAVIVFEADITRPQQQFINMLALGSLYSLFALGYALVFSILGLLNLAHSAVFMWGAFLGLAAVTTWGWPMWTALPVGMLGAGIISIIVDRVAFLPLRRRDAPRTAQLISSIGAAIILVNLAAIFFGLNPQPFPREKVAEIEAYSGIPLDRQPTEDLAIAGETIIEAETLIIRPIQISTFVIAILLMIVLQYLVANTKIGKAMRAVAFRQRTANLLGVNVGLIFAVTFFLAGALGGAAGVLQGVQFSTDYLMGDEISLTGLIVIVLGGLGSIQGAVVGGFLVANMEVVSIMVGYSWLKDAVIFSTLLVMLLLRPRGLLGEKSQDRA